MGFAIALTDEQWELVADLFDPPGRRGAPAQTSRRQMVEAMLFLARTGCQWRYLPERYGSWMAVWAQWRRWRANGVWAAAMTRLAAVVRLLHGREPGPSMVMVDARTVKGGRYGPTFHEAGGPGGRTIGTKRTVLVEILGLPLAARVDSARPHDVVAARELLRDRLPDLPSVRAIVGDRAYRPPVARDAHRMPDAPRTRVRRWSRAGPIKARRAPPLVPAEPARPTAIARQGASRSSQP